MGNLKADVEALEEWSAQSRAIAGELAATAAPPSLPSGQATATAVSGGQALINGAATVMAGRVRATATTAAAAAAAYATNDEQSAQRLAAVSPGPAGG